MRIRISHRRSQSRWKFWTSFLVILISGSTCEVSGQDIHFSQYQNAPLALGPGTIGQFNGDYRLNGIYRQQWRSVTVPYRTFGMGGDAAHLFGIDGLGGGAWLYNDRAGDGRLEQFHFSLGASWTERFGERKDQSVTAGVQFGLTSITLDIDALTFDSQYNGFYFDPGLASGESFSRDGMIHPDVHAGLVYRYVPDERKMVQVGLGLFNLTEPTIGFLDEPGVPLDKRMAFHVLTRFPVHERFDIEPMAQFMTQGPFNEFDLGMNLRHILLDQYGVERAVLFGAHWRADDAGYVYAGLEYDDLTVGVSYDINFSDLVPASRNRGGIEFTVIRIFRKRPAIPARFKACPDQL